MTQVHISEFDIQQAVTRKVEQIELEIQQLQTTGVEIAITARDLLNLEALGLIYDFETQMVSPESGIKVPAVEAAMVIAS